MRRASRRPAPRATGRGRRRRAARGSLLGSTSIDIQLDPGPAFVWATIAGADLGGLTKSVEMPFDPTIPTATVCIDDSPTGGAGTVPAPGACSGVSVAIPAVDGQSTVSGAYMVTRLSTDPPRIRIEGLSHTTLSTLIGPVTALQGLIDQVQTLNPQHGIANSLDSKLAAAQQALTDAKQNNNNAARNAIDAFVSAVQAQAGNQIPQADASALLLDAQAILAQL